MPAFPSVALQKELFKIRLHEPLFSEADNIKLLPLQKGIYRGLKVSVVGSVVKIAPDTGDINLAVIETAAHFSLTFSSIDTYNLDFTGHTSFPVWVVLEAVYTSSADTTGQIFTTLTPQAHHIMICKVVDSSLTVSVVEGIDRDVGLLPALSVGDISATGNVGSSIRYARADHTHKGVRRIIAGAGISVNQEFGDVTISSVSGPVVVDKIVISSVYRDTTVVRYGAPVSFTGSPAVGVKAASQNGILTTPCVGVLLTDNPANGANVDIITHGRAAVHSSVFTTSVGSANIGGPVFIAPMGSVGGRLSLANTPTGGSQRVGAIKEIIGSDIIIIVSVGDVFEDIGV